MSQSAKYKKSLEQRWSTRFETSIDGSNHYDGIVTHIKRGFIVLREEVDFDFDGVVVLPKKRIVGVRDDKHDACCNAILRESGAIKNAKVPKWLGSCANMRDIIAQCKKRDIWPAVELPDDNDDDTAFYLGPITHVDERSFGLNCYDAAGNWEKVYELSYSDIGRIEFDSRYCNAFNTYMRSRTE